MAADFASMVRPAVDARIEPGENLLGIAAATQQKTFSGQLFAVAVTDRRLLLMPVDRRFQAKGDPASVTPDAVASADLDGAGGGWWTAPAAVLDAAALTLRLETTGGEKFKLSMMKGGTGMLGGLGGGQAQSDGVVALAEWLARARGDRSG
jgi:hypothetical protein